MTEVPVATVRQERLLRSTPEDLWPLVSTGAGLARWYAFGGADIELRPGGAVSLRWDEHGEFPATVEQVLPGRLLSFRWQPEGEPLVEIRLAAEGDGTRVTITETGPMANPDLEAGAWHNSLALLQGLVEG